MSFSPERALPFASTLLWINGRTVGDTVVSLPALHAIRRQMGEAAHFGVLHRGKQGHPPAALDLLQGLVDPRRYVVLPISPTWGEVLQALLQLRKHQFAAAAYLDSTIISQRSLNQYRLLLRLGGIARFIGFHPYSHQAARQGPAGPESSLKPEALCRLENLARSGVDIQMESDFSRRLLQPSAARETVRRWLGSQRQRPDRPLVAICPGTREPANQWPLERFIEIGRRLSAQNTCELVVCGGTAESRAAAQLTAAWGQGLNAAGIFSLLETTALLDECQWMLGLDTGTTHLAAAVGTPCLTLQGGRGLPGTWNPLGPGHIVLRYPVPCQGCGLGTCPLSRHLCMQGISVERVWQAVGQMQAQVSPQGAYSLEIR